MTTTTAWEGAPYAPRKWQAEALPIIINELKQGKKPVVSAIMGSGKSILIAELVYMGLPNLKENQVIIITAPRQQLVRQLTSTLANRCGEENVGSFYAHNKTVDKKVIVCCNASVLELTCRLFNKKIAVLIGDEVHGTESDQFKNAYHLLRPACAVGFTATPFRSKSNERLTLWDSVAYRYNAGDAFSDGVIVPWDLVNWNGDDFDAEQVDEICLKMIRKKGIGPGIVSALNIEDAEKFSDFLSDNGVRAEAVHSKMARSLRDMLINKLKDGKLDAIVHVSLLAEGVDMPWLKWLCLRRPVQARVRFVQEVGRVLRSHPDKERAVIMDPHNLFGHHGLTYPEAIGELLVVDDDVEEFASLDLEEHQVDRLKKMSPAQAVGELDAWFIQILSLLRAAGICKAKAESKYGDSWKDKVCSDNQLHTLDKMFYFTKFLPENIREDFKSFCQPATASTMKQGTISNVLDILHGIADASRHKRRAKRYWHCPIALPKPNIPVQGYLFVAQKERKESAV